MIQRVSGCGVVGFIFFNSKNNNKFFLFLDRNELLIRHEKKIGAMLEEPIKEGDSGPPKMKGSAMLIGAKTREEVVERLKKDVYVLEGAWDIEKMQIIPFKSALRKAL